MAAATVVAMAAAIVAATEATPRVTRAVAVMRPVVPDAEVVAADTPVGISGGSGCSGAAAGGGYSAAAGMHRSYCTFNNFVTVAFWMILQQG